MKIAVVKLKDTDNIFIDYKGYKTCCNLKQFECKNNLCIEIETEKEKLDFIEVLKVFQKELERLEF